MDDAARGELIIERLREYWTRPQTCAACGTSEWDMVGETFLPRWKAEERTTDFGHGVPAVALICKKCGFMVFFSCESLGLIGKKP